MGRTTQGTELRIRTRRPCSECAPPMKRPAETNSQQQTHRNRTPGRRCLAAALWRLAVPELCLCSTAHQLSGLREPTALPVPQFPHL